MEPAERRRAQPNGRSRVSGAIEDHPHTGLRRSYERVRGLGLAEQIRECVDQLGHPEVVVGEVLEAFSEVDAWASSRELPPAGEPVDLSAVDLDELSREDFYSTREITVVGRRYSFRCLATGVDPLGDLRPSPAGGRDGLDFVGLTCDALRTPVLGAVQSERDTSAWLLLLRGLACLAEAAPEAQVERLNKQFFLGSVGRRPAFDLHLVVWDEPGPSERTTLDQLTQDLAEKLKLAIREHGRFPSILHDVVCLRMNRARFDGRLRLAWRV
jgi:hypothetical protein